MSTIRLAVAQAAAAPCDVPANVETAARLLELAAAQGAHLVVFPELFLCGYDLAAIASRPKDAALAIADAPVTLLRERCARLGLAAIVGACLSRPDGLTNSAIVIDRRGSIVDVYDKINLWTTERPLFNPGHRLVALELSGFRVGVAICYDAGFPEHTRALTRKGAHIITCPSAFVRGAEQHRYRLYYPLRALENTVYLAVANLAPGAQGPDVFGESAIFDPCGCPITTAGDDEEVIVASVSHDDLARVRRELRYLEHLRPEVYAQTEGGVP